MTDDATLYAALARGDHGALSALYDRHAAIVFKIAMHLTHDRKLADDLVHDAFLDLARAARRGTPVLHVLRWLILRLFE
ncbi:MAG TPA: sigma factor [Kofleriaceae bacterium]|nr:sigma factor [Kofleriaceae bacterium]